MTNTIRGKFNVTRRGLMLSAGAMLAAPALMRAHYSHAQTGLTCVSWGGAYQDMFQRVFADPFGKCSGLPT